MTVDGQVLAVFLIGLAPLNLSYSRIEHAARSIGRVGRLLLLGRRSR
jgi:hypothetical protein